jgi:hypothetical protein
MRFNGVEANTLPIVFHESIEQDKGKELILEVFRSPPLINVEDVEMSPLHVIFDLKGVLVGKDYFRINHLLLPPFNLAQRQTLLGKNILPKLALKEFLLRCLEKFTVYIWMFTPFAKMKAYLKKIVEKKSIEIDPQRIMGRDQCKINKHYL